MIKKWEPFQKATIGLSEIKKTEEKLNRQLTKEEIRQITSGKIYKNNIYQVSVREIEEIPGWPEILWLPIKRIDKNPIHDWRDLQKIKNEIIGPENEGIELYPAESRLVDTSNQYHLFVLKNPEARFPFGYFERLVIEGGDGSPGAPKQRPFDKRPEDCKVI